MLSGTTDTQNNMSQIPSLSVVIPLYNEEESLPELQEWIHQVCTKEHISYEAIYINDGSTDDSWNVISTLQQQYPSQVKGICFQRNYGKSAALQVGFQSTKGKYVITMDADLQDSPDEIPSLIAKIEEGFDLVSGWKKKRLDPKLSKNLPSKFFNFVTSSISGIKLNDFNCGLKAYRGIVVRSIEVYGEMHRFIPILAKQAGFKQITEKVVVHRARKYGVTKFGWERFINGFLDLLSVTFVTRFGKKPMHFFGVWGTIMFLFGFGILAYLSIEKLIFEVPGIATRPMFFFGILTLILGTQFFLAGFLGELISRNSADRNNYLISERI